MIKREIITHLKNKGYKLTDQRELILDVLIDNQNRLISVDYIQSIIKKKLGKLNITTIYRNLEVLTELGILHRTILEDQMTYYKLHCIGEHHHHMICTKCAGITVIDYCPISQVELLADENGFQISHHKLEIYGICQKCRI